MEQNGWSAGQRFLGIIDRPMQAFADIAQRPGRGWLVPVLFLLVGIVSLNVVSAPYSAELAREQVELQMASMPQDQADQVAGQIERFSSPLFVGGMALVTGILGTVVGVLLAAAFLYFVGLVAGGDGTFGAVAGSLLWAWIPFGLRAMVQAGIIFARQQLITNQGLAALVSVGDPIKDASNLLYVLLSQVDLFALWHAVLAYAAARGIFRFSQGKSIVVTVFYLALNLALRGLLVLVSQLFMPSM